MHTYKYKNTIVDCDITYLNGSITWSSSALIEFLDACVTLSNLVSIKTVDFKEIGSIHNYKIVFVDNRVWNQDLIFDFPLDPLMEFHITDQFRVTLFTTQRLVRDALIKLNNEFHITNLSYKII